MSALVLDFNFEGLDRVRGRRSTCRLKKRCNGIGASGCSRPDGRTCGLGDSESRT